MSADTEAATADPTTVKVTDTKPDDSFKAGEAGAENVEKNGARANGDDDNEDRGHGNSGRRFDNDNRGSKMRKNFNGKHNGHGNSNFKHRGGDRRNVRSRYDDGGKTDNPVEIRKQVEFYFSDVNLPHDVFLFDKVGAENNPVPISLIASFTRMKRFEPYSAIVDALRESTTLNVIDGEEPKTEQVQRKVPLPVQGGTKQEEVSANYEHESMNRSIYAKGFGEETRDTQLAVERFFEPYMATAVRLRRASDRTFKGSVFVEFASQDDMQQFLDLEEKPEWKGKELKIMSKVAYCKEKDTLINEGKIRRNNSDDEGEGPRGGFRRERGRGGRGGRGRGRGNYRGNRDRDGSRSRSRSHSRTRARRGSFHDDLRNKNWREIADEEDKERNAKKEAKQEYDDAGIPKVTSTPKKTEDAAANGKKRPLEGDATEDGGEAKKAKAEEDA